MRRRSLRPRSPRRRGRRPGVTKIGSMSSAISPVSSRRRRTSRRHRVVPRRRVEPDPARVPPRSSARCDEVGRPGLRAHPGSERQQSIGGPHVVNLDVVPVVTESRHWCRHRVTQAARMVGGPVVWVVPSGYRMVSCRSGPSVDVPTLVVDLVVVSGADRQEVVEVGAAAVAPPDDVMQFAVVVTHPAPGDRTRRSTARVVPGVGPGSPAGWCGRGSGCRGRATRPRYGPRRCGRRRHRRVRRGPARGSRRGSRTPWADRSVSGGVGVDDHQVLGSSRFAGSAAGEDQVGQRQRPQVILLRAGIGRTGVRRRRREQCFERCHAGGRRVGHR